MPQAPEHLFCTLGTLCFFAENKDFFAAIGPLLVLITALVALGSFVFAIWQYTNAQVWKRNEFLAKEVGEFFADPAVIDVEGMLDYTGECFVGGEGDKRIKIYVYHSTDGMRPNTKNEYSVLLSDALHYHDDGPVFPPELKIRKRFDTYFYFIQRFSAFIDNNLFTKDEIYPYLEYHISLLNGRRDHSTGYHKALYNYLILYDFLRGVKFLGQFPRAEFVQRYIDEASERKAKLSVLPVTEERAEVYRRRNFQIPFRKDARDGR
jgi:hypothetical protein